MNTLLQNGILIDGTGTLPVKDSLIAIRDEKIEYAGAAGGWTDSGEEWLKLDLQGQYILPGLIDAHVHLSGSGRRTASSVPMMVTWP